MAISDPHNLQRFVEAQDGVFETVLAELANGSKQSHWMWFVFPQLAELGRSPTAKFYGIESLGEAEAYLAHPVLAERLHQCADALLPWTARRSAEEIFGAVDAMKLRSSLTLFDVAEPRGAFAQLLLNLFDGGRDERTLALLQDQQ